jgi:L-lactate dehydrogenase complex protein LldG
VSDARAEVLGRVRAALAAAPPPAQEVARAYRRRVEAPRAELVERFCERVADYTARVHRAPPEGLSEAIASACAARGARRLAVPDALVREWLPAALEAVLPPLSPADLDRLDGVVTGCALAIAETGTIVLDGGPAQGPRALTLVPDFHLCVVRAEQVVGLVPEAIERLAGAVRERGAPVTFVSGPSATSDIELSRVEGVHGPRLLDVVVVEG